MTPIEKKIIKLRDKCYPRKVNESKEETIIRISFVNGMKAFAKELEQVPSDKEIRKEATNRNVFISDKNAFIQGARFASTFKVKEK